MTATLSAIDTSYGKDSCLENSSASLSGSPIASDPETKDTASSFREITPSGSFLHRAASAFCATFLVVLHAIGIAAFWILLCVFFLRHLYHDFFEPIIQAAGRAADNDQLRNDITYYNRRCSAQDLTVTKATAFDLLLMHNTSGREAADHMMQHGVSVVPSVFKPSTAKDLLAHVLKRNKELSEKERIFVRPNMKRRAFAVDPVEDESVVTALQEIANHPILQPMLEELVGPDPAITELATLTALPGAKTQDWHNDVIASGSAVKFTRTHSHSYSMFIALQDTTPDMGSTRVCPGSHYCVQSQAELCDRLAVYPSDAIDTGVWPAGYGTIFNQQLWHKGDAHEGNTNVPRVMFIISFTSRPNLGVDNRQLSRGIFCFARWDLWGHTWQDLFDPKIHMTKISSVLRSLAIWKAADRNWGLDFHTKNSMEATLGENGMDPENVELMAAEWQSQGFPSFLHGPISDEEDAWPVYVAGTLENTWTFIVKVNLAFAVAIVTLKSFRSRKSPRDISWLLVAAYVVPTIMLTIQMKRVHESEWGRSVKTGMAFRPPFPSVDDTTFVRDLEHPTTRPERDDVLLGTRFDAPFLGALDRWLDYHPGNRLYDEAISHTAAIFTTYDGLPRIFEDHVVNTVLSSVKPGRLLEQNWRTGDWVVLPSNEQQAYVRRDLRLLLDLGLQEVDKGIRHQLARYRFEVSYRESSLARLSQEYLVALREELVWSGARRNKVAIQQPQNFSTHSIPKIASWLPKINTPYNLQSRTLHYQLARWTMFPDVVATAFKEGDQVVVNLDEDGIWYQGYVRKIRKKGAFNIEFDDGSLALKVNPSLVKHVVPITEGMEVFYKVSHNRKPKLAIAQRVRPMGTMDLMHSTRDGSWREVFDVPRTKYTAVAYDNG